MAGQDSTQDTAVSVLTDIIENLGGTTDAETVVPALKDLQDLLGEGGIGEAVSDYLTEHGVTLGYTVTDGDLDVVVQ